MDSLPLGERIQLLAAFNQQMREEYLEKSLMRGQQKTILCAQLCSVMQPKPMMQFFHGLEESMKYNVMSELTDEQLSELLESMTPDEVGAFMAKMGASLQQKAMHTHFDPSQIGMI